MPIKLTEKRNKILSVLQKAHSTLSAADIHEKIPEIDLVTIYRNLDLFTKEKLIKQVHLGTEEAQYEYQKEPHYPAVCTDCKKIIHFTAPDKHIKKALGLENFEVEEIEVTVRGTCTKGTH